MKEKADIAQVRDVPSSEMRIPSADDPVLAEMVRRRVAVYHPDRIYLFWSVARGDAGPDSDFDIVVVVPDDLPEERLDWGLGYRSLRGLGVAKDLLVWRRGTFDARLHLASSLPSTVLREGRLLYAA